MVKCKYCEDKLADQRDCPYTRLAKDAKKFLSDNGVEPAKYCFSAQVSRAQDADTDNADR